MSQISAVTLPGFALGALFMALANRRAPADVARSRWLKLVVFFLIVHVVLGAAALGRAWVTALVSLILVAGVVELRRACRCVPPPHTALVWLVFGFVAGLALASARALPPLTFAFLFLVTAACDGFSQVVGQSIGRHRLAPRTSPGKTVEGFLGGLLAAVVVALLARGLLVHGMPGPTAMLAVATAVVGLAGDLAASWVKRRAGIKDYSAALPGQGGVLDRFDSLLAVLAVIGPLLVIVDV